MIRSLSFCRIAVGLEAFFLLDSLLRVGIRNRLVVAAPAEAVPIPSQGKATAPSSIPGADLINPQELAKILQSPEDQRPLLIYVGFRLPYTQAHIPGSEFFGPAANPVVVQQFYLALHDLGFTRLKVLYIPDNLGTDWVNKGNPVEKGE